MKVLADFHHHDLWESLELLCGRLGWTLYRPVGMDWFSEGYWNMDRAAHGDRDARRYLDVQRRSDGMLPDNRHPGRWQRTVTLDEARDLWPDVVIASVAHNHAGLGRFAEETGAAFGLHIGNVRNFDTYREDRWDLADFGILTATYPIVPPVPSVTVHQEFSLDDFRREPPNEMFIVSSFVNNFREMPQYAQFAATRAIRPDVTFLEWGEGAADLPVCSLVGDAMRNSAVGWHAKQWSDGFGHVIHNWFAVGRPMLVHAASYRGQLAEPLFVEGITSFDISWRTTRECAALLDGLRLDPDERRLMGEAAYARFREIVDFDEEFLRIRAMFEQVLAVAA